MSPKHDRTVLDEIREYMEREIETEVTDFIILSVRDSAREADTFAFKQFTVSLGGDEKRHEELSEIVASIMDELGERMWEQ